MTPDHDQQQPLEVVAPTALEAMERGALDVQITTAKRYPRDLGVVKRKMLSFATLDTETAAGCFYTLPARKGGDGKPIQGPSVRLAEIAVASYGHIRAAARIISNDGKFITAQGVCHDLENNVSISVEVKRRITTKMGMTYSDDMQVVAGNAACSIALRNAIFKVVPMALVKPVYEQAKQTAVGDAKTLVSRRAAALDMFAKMGVDRQKVLQAVGVQTSEAVGLAQLEVLIGFYNAIKDGDTTIDEVFNPKPEADGGDIRSALGEPAKPSQPQGDRQTTLDRIESIMLDKVHMSEAQVIKFGVERGRFGPKVHELSQLSDETLVAVLNDLTEIANKQK